MEEGTIIILIISISLSIIIGYFFGFFIAFMVNRIKNKKIEQKAQKVIDGEEENAIELDGVKYPAKKFRLRNDKGEEQVINLKGGIMEDAYKENEEETIKEALREIPSSIGEDSPSIGEEKRNPRRRDKLRRFG